MHPEVKAAIITEVGSLLYIVAWVVAMQWFYCQLTGVPEQAWVLRAWRWYQGRAERRFQITVKILNRPAIEEPPADLPPAA